VRWFVDGELRPERFAPDPEPLARGSLIHRVLERTLAQVDFPLRPDALPVVETLVREVVAEEAPRFTLGRGAAAQSAAAHEVRSDVLRLLRHEAQAGGGFAPAELELRFGMGEDGELPALELGGGALRLRGVIDRVDLDGAGHALVRDYKSGRASSRWPVARWAVDDQLQVALYMLAVRELQRRETVGGIYQPLRDTDMRARGIVRDDVDTGTLVHERDRRTGEELDEALTAASARACELAARLLAGELVPTPETCTPQGGCAHPGICRVADA
jgi:RecB family exonuclease